LSSSSRRWAHLVAWILVGVASLGCNDECDEPQRPPKSAYRATVNQGIWGDVWFWSGDFMPFCADGTITPVVRELRVHEATLVSQTEPQLGTLFRRVNTPLVATTRSDERGFFQVSLQPGRYSVFTVEDMLLYANGFDNEGYISPVAVVENSRSEAHVDITYAATYKASNWPLHPSGAGVGPR
jgi:hypothetical protein